MQTCITSNNNVAQAIMVDATTASTTEEPCCQTQWDCTEPLFEGAPCYSEVLKADLLPGTFVLLTSEDASTRSGSIAHTGNCVVARVVAAVGTSQQQSSASVSVNIFRRMKEVYDAEDILYPKVLQENHLRNLAEIVQTAELRVVRTVEITNLAFVFTLPSLRDPTQLFFTCQGMKLAFLLRF